MEIAILLMGGLGLIVGVGLAIASKIFYVYVDPKILAIDDVLPGANCGGCGYPGCTANAEAIVAGKSEPNSCVAAGPEVAEAVAAVLGVSVEAKEPDIALPGCTYGVSDADTKFEYTGLNDCRAAALLSGGMKVCHIGCLGLGTCAAACPFDAITMGPEGLPVVNEERCTGCGTCERVCPKNIITLSSVTRRIFKEYTTEDCTTPCQRACPAGIDISAYIGAIADGDCHKAVQIIKERNPFPTVIGRICPRPCENDCRRQLVDEPVAINFLKRYAADYERDQDERILPYKAPDTQRRLAIIGGGVEGLSTAFFTARLGHAPTVFDAAETLGGLLRAAIARHRLPLDILDWDIEGILAMGVTAKTGMSLGTDFTVAELLDEGYQAVLLSLGGWDSRLLRTAGKGEPSPLPGCHLLIDVAKAGTEGYPQLSLAGKVVIVGNPNVSPEMVQRCKALGASTVELFVRETPSESNFTDATVITGSGIGRFYGQGDHLNTIEVIDLENGDRRKIEANHIIFASGRIPELIVTPVYSETDDASDERTIDGWQAFPPYKHPTYHHERGLLSGGDVLTDFSAAIKAIAAGRRAAVSIHKALYDMPLDLPDNVVTPETPVQNVDRVFSVPALPRQIMPLANSAEVSRNMEIEKGYSSEAAKKESKRCLQCGLICYLKKPSEEKREKAAATL